MIGRFQNKDRRHGLRFTPDDFHMRRQDAYGKGLSPFCKVGYFNPAATGKS
jgi:hypothetical protein